MRRIFCATTILLLFTILPVGLSTANDSPPGTPHTVTWWCVDLNDLWKVDDPVIIAIFNAVPPDPSPIPDTCTNPFPVTVPNGSTFVPGGVVNWITNRVYPPAVRTALAAVGVNVHSESPGEDLRSKIVEIRVEVRTFPDDVLVAEFSFDPRLNSRIVRQCELFGAFRFGPLVDPALGIDISVDEVGRLPLYAFPVHAGPVPPGEYRSLVFWRLSEVHNDGLGLTPDNFLPAGETQVAGPQFTVLP